MTNNIKGLLVAFEQDARPEFIERTRQAILQLRGVAGAERIEAAPEDYVIEQRVRARFRDRMYEAVSKL
jgi:hypothetical protein